VWHQQQADDGSTVVEISDVRFVRVNIPDDSEPTNEGARRRGLRTRAAGFTFQIIFDAAGSVTSHGFKEPE
jgi:hypothetical protein